MLFPNNNLCLSLLALGLFSLSSGFSSLTVPAFRRSLARTPSLEAFRYGPPDLESLQRDGAENNEREILKNEFRNLLSRAMTVTKKDHLPKLLADNIELIFSLRGYEGAQVISEIVDEAKAEGPVHFQKSVKTVETILSFAEDFVNEASQLDNQNKQLLGKIIKAMVSKDRTERDREEFLDQLMEEERENFTPGFLRHLEGECARIANAPKVTPESARLLEIMRIIQTRVLEELGKDLGEAAVVLGQLMGYEDDNELLGVLEAGLTVRGIDFAQEMSDLTKEALDGFQKVPGGVDPGLVERVTFIDSRLNDFLRNQGITP